MESNFLNFWGAINLLRCEARDYIKSGKLYKSLYYLEAHPITNHVQPHVKGILYKLYGCGAKQEQEK